MRVGIEGLDKGAVLADMYNYARRQAFPSEEEFCPLTRDDARRMQAEFNLAKGVLEMTEGF